MVDAVMRIAGETRHNSYYNNNTESDEPVPITITTNTNTTTTTGGSNSRDGGGKKQTAVWLDQLCINQASEDDKTTHVGAMDLIYRSARRVVILLEDVQLADSHEEAAALAYKGFYQDMCDEVAAGGLEGTEKAAFVGGYFARREREWCETRR
ncbi:hypothetical protein Micbo1qcDRAFT_167725, partial [Microdochium bolleyi]